MPALRCAVLAAVVLATCAAAATDTPPVEVTMPGKVFSPGAIDVLTGTTVIWRNTDRSTHTVTSDDDETFDSGHLRPGESFEVSFPKAGVVPFHCTIHRFMRGEVRAYDVVLRGPRDPVLSGVRVSLEGVAPADAPSVTLERLAPGKRVTVASRTGGGTFAFGFRVFAPVTYQARGGTATSPPLRLRVAPRVSLRAVGRSYIARARPARAGATLELQSYDREAFDWRTVARSKLGASSIARITLPPDSPADRLRVVVRGTRGWGDGVSPTVAR